jgi:hypothetical protein
MSSQNTKGTGPYQAPAHVFHLAAQGISLNGEAMQSTDESALDAWKEGELKKFEGVTSVGEFQKNKPLTADQVTALRSEKGSVLEKYRKKGKGWKTKKVDADVAEELKSSSGK